jgi:3-oxoacyl-[acyl-carrier-protein] synthase III
MQVEAVLLRLDMDLHGKHSPYVQMSGRDVFKHAVKGMVQAATEFVD